MASDDGFERHASAEPPSKPGYVLHPFQRAPLRSGSLEDAGRLTALCCALGALCTAVALARGEYQAFAAAARSRSPLKRLWRLMRGGGAAEHNTAQCVASWLSTSEGTLAALTGLACAGAVPLLLWRVSLRGNRGKPMPGIAAAVARAAAFYALVWLVAGADVATVAFIRTLVLNARLGAGETGLALRTRAFQLVVTLWLGRLVGLGLGLELDMLPDVDGASPVAHLFHYRYFTLLLNPPFDGFFLMYLLTNLLCAAARAPWAMLGATSAAVVSFAVAAMLLNTLCDSFAARTLWLAIGGDAAAQRALRMLRDAARALARPLWRELDEWRRLKDVIRTVYYSCFGRFFDSWFPPWLLWENFEDFERKVEEIRRHAPPTDAEVTCLGGASVKLFGAGAAGGLALRGVRAVAAVAHDKAMWRTSFQLARYCSLAALLTEVLNMVVGAVAGAALMLLAAGVGSTTESNWVHGPCLILALVGACVACVALALPYHINVFLLR